ncbi:hypothetical protein NDU88_003471, partial [Pleurodeles waltl]
DHLMDIVATAGHVWPVQLASGMPSQPSSRSQVTGRSHWEAWGTTASLFLVTSAHPSDCLVLMGASSSARTSPQLCHSTSFHFHTCDGV